MYLKYSFKCKFIYNTVNELIRNNYEWLILSIMITNKKASEMGELVVKPGN